jgi:cell division protein FtsB
MAKRRRRPSRSSLVLRWAAVAALAVCAFLYYRPIRSYLETREALEGRRADVRTLRAERQALERRVAFSVSERALALEARRLGFVKPGERLFIVKGIDDWRRRHRATIGRGG